MTAEAGLNISKKKNWIADWMFSVPECEKAEYLVTYDCGVGENTVIGGLLC